MVSAEFHRLSPAEVLGPALPEIEKLWRLVWPHVTEERFAEILPRHASREGFRFLAARGTGSLVGFAYGYAGAPGQWWHDRVAAALTPAARERWLPPGHFEFVELLVHPDFRRRGVGAALHDALLEGSGGTTAVLSTQIDNEPAIRLYEGRGWKTIIETIDLGAPQSYLVMARDLHNAAGG